jgi:pyruvate dehydrogenase E2 component (dihydrolipoamide acetyltransferase)
MPVEILMPALSPTMTEGVLVKWCKNEGDPVKSGEAVAEIETDKATMEVEAAESGTIGRIVVPAGSDKIPVNSVIGWILEKGEDKSVLDTLPTELNVKEPELKEACTPSDPINSLACMGVAVGPVLAEILPEAEESKKPAAHITQAVSASTQPFDHSAKPHGERQFASPLAKRIASQRGIDISSLIGTGPLGRVVKADVLSASTDNIATKTRLAIAAPKPAAKVEISRLRRVIADKMEEIKRTVPHFYLSVGYDMSKMIALRADLNKAQEQNSVRKVSITDLLVKALAMALADMPEANVSWQSSHIMRHGSVDVSVAVSIDGGLVTPIVRQADQKSIFEISADLNELVSRARAGKLKLDDLSGGSFTISNLGMYNIDSFTAILNSPQSFIFAIGATKQTPVVREGKVVVADMMNITASCDHRVIDGMLAAMVMNKIKDYIENPVRLLI